MMTNKPALRQAQQPKAPEPVEGPTNRKNMRISKFIIPLAVMVLAFIAFSCDRQSGYLPKPRGYFRIDLPEKAYGRVDTIERYSFECPQYALVTPDPYSPNEKNWVNIEMPQFKGSIHLTHKSIDGNLGEYLEDVHTMMDGKGVATPMQFYLTDSTKNFVRGALYFNFKPDNDSMQPVISFIRQDIDHMISTFEWK